MTGTELLKKALIEAAKKLGYEIIEEEMSNIVEDWMEDLDTFSAKDIIKCLIHDLENGDYIGLKKRESLVGKKVTLLRLLPNGKSAGNDIWSDHTGVIIKHDIKKQMVRVSIDGKPFNWDTPEESIKIED
jgi:hypothetical protein